MRSVAVPARRDLARLAFLVIGGLVLAASLFGPRAATATAATPPKAYIGLFKDNAVAVLDTASSHLIKTIPVPAGPHGLVVTPDGRWVYASSDGDSVVSVIDTRTDEVTASVDVGSTPHGLAITPDGGRVLVAGFGTDSVEAIDTSTNHVIWQVAVPRPHNIAVTPDGQTAYAGSQKEGAPALAIIDLASGTQSAMVPLDATPRALNLSPDGAELVYTLAGVDAVQVLDLDQTSNQVETQIPSGASPHHPLFTPDGRLGLVVSQGPGTLDLFDPAGYASIGSIKVGDMPHWIATTSDSRWAYVTNEKSNDVSVVDLGSRTVTATVPVGNAPRKIVVQPGAAAAGPASGHYQPSPAAQAAPASETAAASIARFAFSPSSLIIKPGQAVTFTNDDPVTHTTTSTTGAWDSGELAPGASFTLTLQQPGVYAYQCAIHPFMRATLIVQ